MPDTQGAADPATAPDVTSAAQNSAKDVGHPDLKRALSAVREQVKECRTPEETLALYDMLLGHTGLPAEVRQQAEEDRAEWKRKADDGLVRFGSKWSNQSEVRAARIQAQFELKEGLELIRLDQGKLGVEKLLSASKTNPESIQADFIAATSLRDWRSQVRRGSEALQDLSETRSNQYRGAQQFGVG